tara:strand:+ start:138 stop:470 length:333 start_codon:yes stop_codon:yes gene_type:complete
MVPFETVHGPKPSKPTKEIKMVEIIDDIVRIRIGFITVPGVENVEMYHCQQAVAPFGEHYEVIYRECSDQVGHYNTAKKAIDSFTACSRHAMAGGGMFDVKEIQRTPATV